MKDNTLLHTVAVILAAGVVLTGIIAALDTSATSDSPRTIQVNGEAERDVTPDEVVVRLSVVTEADTAQEASSANAETMSAVVSALKEYGEVETEQYRVDPVRDYSTPKEGERDLRIRFYRATNTVSVTMTDTGSAGDAIDAGIAAGANDVSGVSWQLSDEQRNAVRAELLSEAGTNAREKADGVASGLGLTVGKVQSVSEGNVHFPGPVYMERAAMDAGGGASTPVEPGNVEVRASVSVSYLIG